MKYVTLMLSLVLLLLITTYVVKNNNAKAESEQKALDSCKFKYQIVLQYDLNKKTPSQYSAVCDSFQMDGKTKIDIWNHGVKSHIEAERIVPFTN